MLGKLLGPTIEEMIKARDFSTLKQQLSDLPEADLAELLHDLEPSDRSLIFRLFPKDKATDIFEYLDVEDQQQLLNFMSEERVKHILNEMSVDDRTALLDELPAEAVPRLLQLLPAEDRLIATKILNYPEDSVGRLITTDYLSFGPGLTVGEALERIRIVGMDKETIYTSYILGPRRELHGIVTLRKLVISNLDEKLEDLMLRNFVSLPATMEAEEAVEMIRRYDLMAMPVVDKDGRLLGIVTFDDLMDVAEEEYREDMDRLAAVVPGEDERYLDETARSQVFRRAPWLIGLLFVEAVAALVLSGYASLMDSMIALSFFIPIMMATGGNTGTQSATMVIRALATGQLEEADVLRVVLRQLISGLMLSLVLGGVAFGLSFFLEKDPRLGIAVAVGLSFIVAASNIVGGVLPIFLKRMKLDPALMSGPFISTLVDVFGLVIYFEVCRYILKL